MCLAWIFYDRKKQWKYILLAIILVRIDILRVIIQNFNIDARVIFCQVLYSYYFVFVSLEKSQTRNLSCLKQVFV